MPFELIYTSVPRGLRSGSTGFCTVAQTEGIPEPLAEQLELLSGYRHLTIGGDPACSNNPVVYSHTVVVVGRRSYRVVSRIADTGLDHTERSNYLAHHVAFAAEEAPPEGPGWLCRSWPFETKWTGAPRKLPMRSVPSGHARPQKCVAWEAATGDAGWAGVFASAARAGENASLVCPTRHEILPLLDEALGLLSPEERWNVTFNTFYTSSAATTDCRWRCVPSGTPEARAAIAAGRGLVLRLDRDPPAPNGPTGPLVEAARTGVVPPAPAREQPRPALPPIPSRHERGAERVPVPASFSVADEPESADEAEHVATVPPPPTPPAPRRMRTPAPLPPPAPGASFRPLFLSVAFGLVVAVLGVAIFELASGRRFVWVPGKNEVALAKERDDTQQRLDEARNQAAQLTEELAGTKDRLTKTIDAATETKKTLAEEIARLTHNLGREKRDLAAEKDKLLETNRTLTVDIGTLKVERDKLTEANKMLAAGLGTLKVEQDKLLETNRKLTADIGTLKVERDKLSQANKMLAADLGTLKVEQDKLFQTNKMLAADLGTLKVEQDKIIETNRKLTADSDKLKVEKAQAEKARDEFKQRVEIQSERTAAGVVPLSLAFEPGKDNALPLSPEPEIEVYPPPGFHPNGPEVPGPRTQIDYVYLGEKGREVAKIWVDKNGNSLHLTGQPQLALALIRFKPGAGRPSVYYQLLPETKRPADRLVAEKPTSNNKDVRYEFPLSKLGDPKDPKVLQDLLGPTTDLLAGPGRPKVAFGGVDYELSQVATAPGAFEYSAPNGSGPTLRLSIDKGKAVVAASGPGVTEASPCRVVYLELGRRIAWQDGQVTWQRILTVGDAPGTPKK